MSIQDQNRIAALEQRLAALEAWLAEFKVKAGISAVDKIPELSRDIQQVVHANLDVIGRKGKK